MTNHVSSNHELCYWFVTNHVSNNHELCYWFVTNHVSNNHELCYWFVTNHVSNNHELCYWFVTNHVSNNHELCYWFVTNHVTPPVKVLIIFVICGQTYWWQMRFGICYERLGDVCRFEQSIATMVWSKHKHYQEYHIQHVIQYYQII